MSNTKIEWADKVWNPVTGCTPVSEGCKNCYAAQMAKRLAGRYGYPMGNPFKVTFHPDKLNEPMRWRKSQKIFVCSMGDLFHEEVGSVASFLILSMINKCPRHVFMLLTKRPKQAKLVFEAWASIPKKPIPNLWLGVTAENQRTADERIPILLKIPATKHFVSVEPMLEFMNLSDYLHDNRDGLSLDWVIAGPETGSGARPILSHWMNVLANDCKVAGVPFFDKKNVLNQNLQQWPD